MENAPLAGWKEGIMSMVEVDARGQQCPIPVVRAKKALAEAAVGDVVRVLIDNDVAVNNLKNLAASLKCTATDEKFADDDFAVSIEKGEAAQEAADCGCMPMAIEPNRVVSIGSQYMGSGNDELGAILMKGFIFALTQQDVLPQTMLFYNSGAVLTFEGSESLEDLRTLEAAGVEILTCGTCLNHYEMAEKLAVGGVTNLYVTAEKQLNASVIVRP